MTETPQSFFKSLSTKLPRDEATLIEDYCRRKGTTVSKLLRDVALREIEVPVPHYVAGHNKVSYNERSDTFAWSVRLDDGTIVPVIEHLSPAYLEDLSNRIESARQERDKMMNRTNGVAVPSEIGVSKRE